jgi:hypothetical protein
MEGSMDNDRTMLTVPVLKNGSKKLLIIAKELGFSGLSDMMRVAVVEYCQAHDKQITLEELIANQWGGKRDVPSERIES